MHECHTTIPSSVYSVTIPIAHATPTTQTINGTQIFQSLTIPGTKGSVSSNGTGKMGLANTMASTATTTESTNGKKDEWK